MEALQALPGSQNKERKEGLAPTGGKGESMENINDMNETEQKVIALVIDAMEQATRSENTMLDAKLLFKKHFPDGITDEATVTRQREALEKALKEAVAVIRFDDNSDFEAALWDIVEATGGPDAAKLLEEDPKAAYDKYCKESP